MKKNYISLLQAAALGDISWSCIEKRAQTDKKFPSPAATRKTTGGRREKLYAEEDIISYLQSAGYQIVTPDPHEMTLIEIAIAIDCSHANAVRLRDNARIFQFRPACANLPTAITMSRCITARPAHLTSPKCA